MTSAESSSGINFEGSSSRQHYRSGESLAEWRSSEQVENGAPSTSLPYWDSDDDDDDDGGQKPSDLYGRYTWKIDKFSEINKRELRSDVFDVGGYEWYILIYPQGCDVCNHLSLFLCVANHEKLKPGWSHFAQFTIAVVNKEPKKSKCSDTLHRFWKKEHDWGWKKFIELSKVWEGFIENDTLIIKAQVQVLRERADRPFRCLDILYRRELVRIYLANVVQICRLFVEDRRGKLVKLIEDRATWCSFRSFWLNMDEGSRNYMSREKAEAILKVVVKQFFIEKEVSSTLVMDSLYSGLKALKGHIKKKTGNSRYNEPEDYPYPMIRMEDDTFVLIDDLLPLLEMAAMESLPAKDEKGPQIRTKDGDAGENLNKDPTERDERRLTELGRRTIEIFVLTHIFSKIEIAYQEAVALRMQEELIQEEAALLAGSEQKGKRGAAEKEKKSKKKGKQKRNNRKVKDKEKDDKSGKNEQAISPVESEAVLATESEMAVEKSDVVEDISDAYDSLECVPEVVGTDSKDADAEIVQPDSSSDSFSEVVRRKPQTGNSWTNKNRKSRSRGKNQQKNVVFDSVDFYSVATRRDSKAVEPLSKTEVSLSQDTVVEKVAKPPSLPRESINAEVCTHLATTLTSPPKSESKVSSGNEISGVKRSSKDSFKQADRPLSPANSARDSFKPAPETQKLATPQPVEKSTDNQVQVASEKPPMQHLIAKTDKPSMPILSRPSSAPITSGREPIVSTVSMPQATPVLARCVRDAGHMGLEPSVSAAQSYVPQSYRNAVFGCLANQNQPTSSLDNGSLSYAHAASLASSPMMLPQSSDRIDTDPIMPSSSFEMMNRHPQNRSLWNDPIQRDNDARNLTMDRASPLTGTYSFDQHSRPLVGRSQHNPPFEFSADHRSSRQGHALAEDFPHLDIINFLLDDEHGIGRLSMSDLANTRRTFSDGLHSLDRQFSFPGEAPSGLGPSASPAGFSRTRSYHEIGGGYGASRNYFHQLRPGQRRNGHNGSGYWPNQQQRHLPGSELPYQMNEDDIGYQNLNIHAVFRPSNGH